MRSAAIEGSDVFEKKEYNVKKKYLFRVSVKDEICVEAAAADLKAHLRANTLLPVSSDCETHLHVSP